MPTFPCIYIHSYMYVCIFNGLITLLVPEGGGDDDIALCLVAKQLLVHELPPVLILHFKRFTIDPYQVTKNSNYMSFPPALDVAPYCSEACLEV